MMKIRISFKLPKALNNEINLQIVKEGRGLRGKSVWIEEAINLFLKLPNYTEFVDIASEMEQLSEMISIRVSPEVYEKLSEGILQVRKEYPRMEGVQSNIIRASIIQRLIR